MLDADQVSTLAGGVKAGLLAGFGGIVGYLADVVHRDKEFSWIAYGVFVLTAFFVGQVLDGWLPDDMPGRGGVLMVAGTSAYPILIAMQSRVAAIIEKLKA